MNSPQDSERIERNTPTPSVGLGVVEFAFLQAFYDFDTVGMNSSPPQRGNFSDPQRTDNHHSSATQSGEVFRNMEDMPAQLPVDLSALQLPDAPRDTANPAIFSAPPSANLRDGAHKHSNPNFNQASGKDYVVFEGTVLETVLVTRLNGDFAGPVVCMLTNNIIDALVKALEDKMRRVEGALVFDVICWRIRNLIKINRRFVRADRRSSMETCATSISMSVAAGS